MIPQSRRRESGVRGSVGCAGVPSRARRWLDVTRQGVLVNAVLIAPLLATAGCYSTATPGRFALTWENWSLQNYDRCFTQGCIRPAGEPTWLLTTADREYDGADYAILGTGDGTLDLAPRGSDAGAEPWRPVAGPRRLEGIPTPLAKELSQVAHTETFVRLYLAGGAVMDARWVERGRPEARGEDVLGDPFALPDDNIVLVQGRQVVAGAGAGRVGLRVKGESGVTGIDYGLNAGARRDRDAATSLGNGVIRLPVKDLREGWIHPRGAGAILVRLYAFAWRYPKRLVFVGPSALMVSLGSILTAPVYRPAGGAGVREVPTALAARIGDSGVEDGMLWIAVLPPEDSDAIWALRADEIRVRWWESGGKRTQPPAGREGQPLLRPVLLDPVRGTKLWFFKGVHVPADFDLEIDALHSTGGKRIARAVYKMNRRSRVRWNPVGVFRDRTCREPEFEP